MFESYCSVVVEHKEATKNNLNNNTTNHGWEMYTLNIVDDDIFFKQKTGSLLRANERSYLSI